MIGLIDTGRLSTVYNSSTVSANSSYNGGFAYDNAGKLQVDTAAVPATATRRSGIALHADGVVCVTTSDPGATSSAMGGLLMTSTGQLHVHVTDAVVGAVGGIPVTAKGAVAVSAVT